MVELREHIRRRNRKTLRHRANGKNNTNGPGENSPVPGQSPLSCRPDHACTSFNHTGEYIRRSKRATTCNQSPAVRSSASKLLFQASVTVRSDRPAIRKSFIRGRLPQVMLKAEGMPSVRSLKAWIFRFQEKIIAVYPRIPGSNRQTAFKGVSFRRR